MRNWKGKAPRRILLQQLGPKNAMGNPVKLFPLPRVAKNFISLDLDIPLIAKNMRNPISVTQSSDFIV
jgi:hypothetical protein